MDVIIAMPHSPLDRPESIPAVFVEAWNARDPDTIAALFDEDADFVNVVGLWWRDREAIRRAHAYGLERIFNRSRLTVTTTRVRELAPGFALVHARMRLTGQSPAAGVDAPGDRRNIFSFVVRLGPESWRCVSAHNTDVVPGAETNVIDAQGRLRGADYRRD